MIRWNDLATLGANGKINRKAVALAALQDGKADMRIEAMLAARDFARTTNVVNGASELLLELFGPEIGRSARTVTPGSP